MNKRWIIILLVVVLALLLMAALPTGDKEEPSILRGGLTSSIVYPTAVPVEDEPVEMTCTTNHWSCVPRNSYPAPLDRPIGYPAP